MATSATALTGVASALASAGTASTQSIFQISKNDLLALLESTQLTGAASTSSGKVSSLLTSFDQAASANGTMSLSQFRSFATDNGISLGSSSQATSQTGSTYASYAGGASGTTSSSATTGGSAATGSGAATGSTASASASSAAGATTSADSTSSTEDLAALTYSELEIRAAAGDQSAIKELERRSALYGGNIVGQPQSAGALFSAYA